jgi:hypothetical protein
MWQRRTAAALAVVGALTMSSGLVMLSAPAASADNEQVCGPLDSGKIDTKGDPDSVTVSAPAGQLIDGYCVKAGSANQGEGPTYVEVVPPQQTVTISHPSGKDVSHYSVSYTTLKAPDDVVVKTPEQRKSCEDGVESRTKTVTKEHVYVDGGWVLEPEAQWEVSYSSWKFVRDLTRAEKEELGCYGDQPKAEVVKTTEERKSCEAGVESRTKTVTKEYVLEDGGWVLEPESDWTVSYSDWTFVRDLSDSEKEELGCEVEGVELVAPTVTFTDPTCKKLDGASWKGTMSGIVDYAVTGTPGLGASVVVTATIKPDKADQFAFPEGFDNTFEHTYPTIEELDCEEVLPSESSNPEPEPGDKPGDDSDDDGAPVVLGTSQAVPTAVDAGLVGTAAPADEGGLLAQLLLVGGLLMLLAGGALGFGRREVGARQA